MKLFTTPVCLKMYGFIVIVSIELCEIRPSVGISDRILELVNQKRSLSTEMFTNYP